MGETELLRGKRVLELGSGAGFLGILIGQIQRAADPKVSSSESMLLLTDVNHAVLERCRENLKLDCSE